VSPEVRYDSVVEARLGHDGIVPVPVASEKSGVDIWNYGFDFAGIAADYSLVQVHIMADNRILTLVQLRVAGR
jgi:hypothetical protein